MGVSFRVKGIHESCLGDCNNSDCLVKRIDEAKNKWSLGEPKMSLDELRRLAEVSAFVYDRGGLTLRAACTVLGCGKTISIETYLLDGVEKCPECRGLGYFPESHNGNYCKDCGRTGIKGGKEALGF